MNREPRQTREKIETILLSRISIISRFQLFDFAKA
jgi:hypothetical protein